MKTYYKTITLGIFAILLSACTLGLQDNFQPDETDFPNIDPFKDQTAWEFIQTETTPGVLDSDGRKQLSLDKLDFFIEAIKHVGYEDLYNQNSTERTYMLLNNNAFMGNVGSTTEILPFLLNENFRNGAAFNAEEVISRITDPGKINILKAILKYHIIGDFVNEHTLILNEKNFVFKSILPNVILNENGEAIRLSNNFADVHLRRTTDLILQINGPATLAPEEFRFNVTQQAIRTHNLLFKNGVGHYLSNFAAVQDYNLYNNLSVD